MLVASGGPTSMQACHKVSEAGRDEHDWVMHMHTKTFCLLQKHVLLFSQSKIEYVAQQPITEVTE